MSFYSRPPHLRVPLPGEKNSPERAEKLAETTSPASATDGSSVPPATESGSAPETGSALEAWSSPHDAAMVAVTPRVREQNVSKEKTRPATAQKKAAVRSEAVAPSRATPSAQDSVKTASSELHDETHFDQQRNRATHRATRVLVIENDVENADHVINILESDGYTVEIATDATYGVMLAQSYLPHLILLGALSEHLSGADFMRSLRNVPGFAERAQITPVLYLIDNSHLLQQRFQGLRDTPLTNTIFKPVNERELLQKIERALHPDSDFASENS